MFDPRSVRLMKLVKSWTEARTCPSTTYSVRDSAWGLRMEWIVVRASKRSSSRMVFSRSNSVVSAITAPYIRSPRASSHSDGFSPRSSARMIQWFSSAVASAQSSDRV